MATKPVPSKLNLALMNLFLGMCKGAAELPRHFRVLGYSDKCVELGFQNSAGELVVPELIVASRRLGHSILFEWKSGPNTDEDQLRRYSEVTAADLLERATLSPEESASHDIALIGYEEFAERLAIPIDANSYPFPLLLVTDDGLDIFRNRFTPDDTDRIFRPRLEFDWDKVPSYFFPVDADFELWEVAELLIPRIMELMGQGEARVLITQLEQAIPSWNIMAPPYRGRLRAKINTVMSHACERQFRAYIQLNRDGGARNRLGPHWDIVNNPILAVSDRRNREWKRLGAQQKAFLDFLRTGGDLPEQGVLNLQARR
ncbi:MAG: hypothetical protein WCD49_04120 [Candidatus Acidiferrales bacterium]